jgi:hypothetical protein
MPDADAIFEALWSFIFGNFSSPAAGHAFPLFTLPHLSAAVLHRTSGKIKPPSSCDL